tara:strand:- start:275 stop:529 length:255 start_codon:yes stop_codon:yes gene_type:complete
MKYFINHNKENTSKYIIYDNDCYYTGFVGIKKDSCFLKFVRTAIYKIDTNKITKYNFNQFNNILTNDFKNGIISHIDYKKLYLR